MHRNNDSKVKSVILLPGRIPAYRQAGSFGGKMTIQNVKWRKCKIFLGPF
jgi:hypothetical protein